MTRIVLPPLKWLPSPNHSTRGGVHVDLFVLHETAGPYRSALGWLRNPKSEASSTLLLPESAAFCAQLVALQRKPWTQCAFNPRSVSLELANVTAKGYHDEHQLRVAARICGWVLHSQGLPLRWSRNGSTPGVCRHLDLGAAGCGHTQCGPSLEGWHRFLNMVESELDRGGWRKAWAR